MNKSSISLVREDAHLHSFNEEVVKKYVDFENLSNYQK